MHPQPTQDRELLRRFAQTRDESAFATLVRRHLNLVYSAALRHLRDAQLAEDASQIVFALLAGRAGDLKSDVIVPGWLVQTTRFVCLDMMRKRNSRTRAEQNAARLKPMISEPPDNFVADQSVISSQLDGALAQLGEVDRDAVVLRYFCDQSIGQIGATLGMSEVAATKRLSRAIGRLRGIMSRHASQPVSESMLTTILTRAVVPAPVGLAERASVLSPDALKHAAHLARTMPITSSKGVITVAAITKTKLAAAALMLLALAGVGSVIYHFVEHRADDQSIAISQRGQKPTIDLRTPQSALHSVFSAVDAADAPALKRCLYSASDADVALNSAWADATIAAINLNDVMQQHFGQAGLRMNGNGPLWPSAMPLPASDAVFNVESTTKPDIAIVGTDADGWGRLVKTGGEWKLDITTLYPRDNNSGMTSILTAAVERTKYLRNDIESGHCRTLADAMGQRNTCGDGYILVNHREFELSSTTQPVTGASAATLAAP